MRSSSTEPTLESKEQKNDQTNQTPLKRRHDLVPSEAKRSLKRHKITRQGEEASAAILTPMDIQTPAMTIELDIPTFVSLSLSQRTPLIFAKVKKLFDEKISAEEKEKVAEDFNTWHAAVAECLRQQYNGKKKKNCRSISNWCQAYDNLQRSNDILYLMVKNRQFDLLAKILAQITQLCVEQCKKKEKARNGKRIYERLLCDLISSHEASSLEDFQKFYEKFEEKLNLLSTDTVEIKTTHNRINNPSILSNLIEDHHISPNKIEWLLQKINLTEIENKMQLNLLYAAILPFNEINKLNKNQREEEREGRKRILFYLLDHLSLEEKTKQNFFLWIVNENVFLPVDVFDRLHEKLSISTQLAQSSDKDSYINIAANIARDRSYNAYKEWISYINTNINTKGDEEYKKTVYQSSFNRIIGKLNSNFHEKVKILGYLLTQHRELILDDDKLANLISIVSNLVPIKNAPDEDKEIDRNTAQDIVTLFIKQITDTVRLDLDSKQNNFDLLFLGLQEASSKDRAKTIELLYFEFIKNDNNNPELFLKSFSKYICEQLWMHDHLWENRDWRDKTLETEKEIIKIILSKSNINQGLLIKYLLEYIFDASKSNQATQISPEVLAETLQLFISERNVNAASQPINLNLTPFILALKHSNHPALFFQIVTFVIQNLYLKEESFVGQLPGTENPPIAALISISHGFSRSSPHKQTLINIFDFLISNAPSVMDVEISRTMNALSGRRPPVQFTGNIYAYVLMYKKLVDEKDYLNSVHSIIEDELRKRDENKMRIAEPHVVRMLQPKRPLVAVRGFDGQNVHTRDKHKAVMEAAKTLVELFCQGLQCKKEDEEKAIRDKMTEFARKMIAAVSLPILDKMEQHVKNEAREGFAKKYNIDPTNITNEKKQKIDEFAELTWEFEKEHYFLTKSKLPCECVHLSTIMAMLNNGCFSRSMKKEDLLSLNIFLYLTNTNPSLLTKEQEKQIASFKEKIPYTPFQMLVIVWWAIHDTERLIMEEKQDITELRNELIQQLFKGLSEAWQGQGGQPVCAWGFLSRIMEVLNGKHQDVRIPSIELKDMPQFVRDKAEIIFNSYHHEEKKIFFQQLFAENKLFGEDISSFNLPEKFMEKKEGKLYNEIRAAFKDLSSKEEFDAYFDACNVLERVPDLYIEACFIAYYQKKYAELSSSEQSKAKTIIDGKTVLPVEFLQQHKEEFLRKPFIQHICVQAERPWPNDQDENADILRSEKTYNQLFMKKIGKRFSLPLLFDYFDKPIQKRDADVEMKIADSSPSPEHANRVPAALRLFQPLQQPPHREEKQREQKHSLNNK